MSIRRTLFTGALAGAMALVPLTAFATESGTPSTPTTPSAEPPPSTPAPKPEEPLGRLRLAPNKVHAGDRVTAHGNCFGTDQFGLTGPDVFPEISQKIVPVEGGVEAKVTYQVPATTKPGAFQFTLHCGTTSVDVKLTVLAAEKAPEKPAPAKQVKKVPAGAPETGGGPATEDPASIGWLLAGLAGVGVLGTGGVLLLERRRNSDVR